MIKLANARQYCCEDVSLIENYELAVTDSETWDCHHRGEILPCGRFATADLKKFKLYWKRPASELVFIRHKDHIGMHHKGIKKTEETRKRMSEGRILFAKTHTIKGHHKLKGRSWYNNGIRSTLAYECPDGYVKGRIV